jgi:glycogen synthase
MVMYSEGLAHMIYAAADIVLVPSMFEPCGLTQVRGCCTFIWDFTSCAFNAWPTSDEDAPVAQVAPVHMKHHDTQGFAGLGLLLTCFYLLMLQMIALRYGGVPVVRKTGGLADTIHDVDHHSGDPALANGFSFEGTDDASLHSALDRALNMFKDKQEEWKGLSIRNMKADVSWAGSAKSYVQVYKTIATLH